MARSRATATTRARATDTATPAVTTPASDAEWAASSPLKFTPSLADAAGRVASPLIRNMGTLGGNVLLDTRCLFYNQTEFWRESLGYCLKAEGTWCHVVGGPKTCVATQSSDTVPAALLTTRNRTLGVGTWRFFRFL